MVDKKLSMAYLKIPRTQLLNLISIDSKKVYNIMKTVRNDWVKNKRCDCCNHPLIISGKDEINCKHIRKAWDDAIGDLNKKWNQKISCLLFKNLATSFHGKEKR